MYNDTQSTRRLASYKRNEDLNTPRHDAPDTGALSHSAQRVYFKKIHIKMGTRDIKYSE